MILSTKFEKFTVDTSAFSADCEEKELVRGTYSVCVASVAPEEVNIPSSTGQASSKTRLIILIVSSSVVVIILIFVSGRLLSQPKAPDVDQIFTNSRHGVTFDSTDDHALLEWRIDAEELLPIRRIAIRPYGSIWLANYLSETVIVKRINQKHISAKAQQDFIRRLTILARLDHPNILRLIGIAWTTEVDVRIVVEYMSTGNLRRYLTLTKDDPIAKEWTSRKLAIALSIAHALVYIHSRNPQVLHRDLKSRSILLDEDLSAKVSGFGLHHYKSEILSETATKSPKSNRSIAPEVLAGESEYSEEAEMYAFGVILSELDSHEKPFSDVKLSNGEPLTEQAMLQLLVAGALQPTVSPNCPTDVGALMYDCLSFNPDNRPTALSVVQRLQSTMEHLQRLSEVGEDLLSSQEHMDSFLGLDSSRQKSSSVFSIQQGDSSIGKETRSTGRQEQSSIVRDSSRITGVSSVRDTRSTRGPNSSLRDTRTTRGPNSSLRDTRTTGGGPTSSLRDTQSTGGAGQSSWASWNNRSTGTQGQSSSTRDTRSTGRHGQSSITNDSRGTSRSVRYTYD